MKTHGPKSNRSKALYFIEDCRKMQTQNTNLILFSKFRKFWYMALGGLSDIERFGLIRTAIF